MSLDTGSDPGVLAYLALGFLSQRKFGVRKLLDEGIDAETTLERLAKAFPGADIDDARRRAERESEAAGRGGAEIICPHDSRYPPLLREIPGQPLALYVRGSLSCETPIALVGSRKPSAYGLGVAERFAKDLAAHGSCVVSGLAYGIDSAAHRGAIEGNGKTIAVLGSGLNQIYPHRHADLAERIVGTGGGLVSELPMDTRPDGRHFPERNRIIAGMSQGVCVVEATNRSGSLITARLAGEYGRMVWAVPNRIGEELAEGIISLLRDGAVAVASADDILGDVAPSFRKNLRNSGNRGIVADAVLDAVRSDGSSFDEIVAATGLRQDEASTRLLKLELAGRIVTMAGGLYRKIL